MIPTDELEGYPKRASARRYVIAAVVLALLAGAAYGIVRPASDARDEAPEFSLELLDGSGRLGSDELRGHPVVLNFFASWCVPCREEAPLLESKWRQYRAEGVRFVGVNIRDLPGDARAFVRRYGLTFPIVRDPGQALASQLDLVGLPQTFFITAEWKLAAQVAGEQLGATGPTQVLGAISEEELDRNIAALLATQEP